MTINSVDADARQYTRQHDRILFAVVQQIQELNTRLQFVENVLDPQVDAPTMGDFVAVDASRTASANLSEEISMIESSLQSIVAALDAPSRLEDASADAPVESPAARPVSTSTPTVGLEGDPVVVDLTASRRPKWRSEVSRPAGWQPVQKRKA
jgi:hypothetical protein